jgi:hypothetical protein
MSDVAQPAPGHRLRRGLESHLGSRDVARVIYGAVVGLAVVVAMQAHPPSAAVAAGVVVGSALAVGLAELYSEIVGTEARTRRPVLGSAVREMAGEALAVFFGAGFPALFFIASALGVMEVGLAFTLSKWSGVVLICGYGYLAARLSGSSRLNALVHAAAVGAIGGFLIGLKAVLH